MNTFLQDKRFPEYFERIIDLKNAECAQPETYAGVRILKLTDDPTFCKEGGEEIEQGLRFEEFLKRLLASDFSVLGKDARLTTLI